MKKSIIIAFIKNNFNKYNKKENEKELVIQFKIKTIYNNKNFFNKQIYNNLKKRHFVLSHKYKNKWIKFKS